MTRWCTTGGATGRCLAGAVLLLLLLAGGAPAAGAQTPAPAAAGPRAHLAVSPVGAVLGAFIAEYEHRLAPTRTLGLSTTTFRSNGDLWSSAEIKLRYYPERTAPLGPAVVGSVGFLHAGPGAAESKLGTRRLSVDAASLSAGADYTRGFGRARLTTLGVGAGYKVLLSAGRFELPPEEPCVFICFDLDYNVADTGNEYYVYYPYLRAVVGRRF